MMDLLLLLIGVPVAVLGFADYQIVTFVLLSAIGWHVAWKKTDRSWKKLFLWAAFYGTVGEAVCVYGHWTRSGGGLWIYRFPFPFGLDLKLPIWLPLVWGNLFVLYAGLAMYLSPRHDVKMEKKGMKIAHYFLVLLITAYAGLLYRSININILYVFTPFFVAFILYWNSFRDIVLFLIAAVLGSAGEIISMRQGLWLYTMPKYSNEFTDWLGVQGLPISLAMAWGLSAVFVYRVSRS